MEKTIISDKSKKQTLSTFFSNRYSQVVERKKVNFLPRCGVVAIQAVLRIQLHWTTGAMVSTIAGNAGNT
jgi:hypothetical protein